MTEMNWVRLYMHINLTMPNEVTSAALPSLLKCFVKLSIFFSKDIMLRKVKSYLIVIGTHSMFGFFDVNGLATDASALDNDIPEFAFKLK
jgi:hypothetical protein